MVISQARLYDTVGATPSTGRRRRGGRAFDGQWVAWASGVWGAERRALCDAACEIMILHCVHIAR